MGMTNGLSVELGSIFVTAGVAVVVSRKNAGLKHFTF